MYGVMSGEWPLTLPFRPSISGMSSSSPCPDGPLPSLPELPTSPPLASALSSNTVASLRIGRQATLSRTRVPAATLDLESKEDRTLQVVVPMLATVSHLGQAWLASIVNFLYILN
jgi:hypothetical protein